MVELAQIGGECAQVLVGESVGLAAEHQQCLQQGVAAPVGQPQTRYAGAGGGGEGVGDGVQGVGAGDRVVAESLDVEQTSVGGEADLAERGQIGQPFPDLEVAGVVDGGFGA